MYVQVYGNARTYRKRDHWILNEKSGQNGSCQKLKIWSRVQGHPDLSDYGLSTFRIWLYWPRIVCPYLLIILPSVQIENSSAKFQKLQTSWKYFLEWNWMGRSSDKWVQNMFTSQISNLTHIVLVIHTRVWSVIHVSHILNSVKLKKLEKFIDPLTKASDEDFHFSLHESYHIYVCVIDYESSLWKLIEMKQQNERAGLGLAASPSGETECKMDSLRSIVKGLSNFGRLSTQPWPEK